MAGLLVVSVVGVLTGVSLSQSEAPKHPLSLEAQSELKAAEAARLDGLYDQAAEHQLKAIRVDPSHPELLSLLPGLFKDARQPDARQPLHLLASIDALLAFSRTATRDKANAAINELKQRASIQENLLLTEAENLLKKLPNGSALYDSQIGYVNVPQEEFAATKERDEILDKQFRAKWATMEAIYDACVRGGNLQKTAFYLCVLSEYDCGYNRGNDFPRTTDSSVRAPYQHGGASLKHRIDSLAEVQDWGRLHEIRDVLERGGSVTARRVARDIDGRIPDLNQAQSAFEEAIRAANGSAAADAARSRYRAQNEKIWDDYLKRPVKRAELSDWLDLLGESDPMEGVNSAVQRIESLPNSQVDDAPRQLAVKAAEIGNYLWQIQELERRSVAPTQ